MTAIRIAACAVALVGAAMAGEARQPAASDQTALARAVAAQERTAALVTRLRHERQAWPEERERFTQAAETAWRFLGGHFEPHTGFIRPLGNYPYTTLWDIGGMLVALYSARELGFIAPHEYMQRVDRILDTMLRVPLYEDRAFNKWYRTTNGAMLLGERGAGWSTTDLGRFFVALKIVAAEPRFSAKAEAIVARNDFSVLVKDGYLWGLSVERDGSPRGYQEGRIGYEQYAARGFALWGHPPEHALSLDTNAIPVTIMGETLPADYRRWDRLTNEPFVLQGLEVGLDERTGAVIRRLVRAQHKRYSQTGRVTIVGEDAVPVPPHYFYYYSAWAWGQQFAVEGPERGLVDGPRWVSAKSAFGLHALAPTPYTAEAIEAVQPARGAAGWASGVYEQSGAATGAVSINTAAVIMAAALVDREGESLLAQAHGAMSE